MGLVVGDSMNGGMDGYKEGREEGKRGWEKNKRAQTTGLTYTGGLQIYHTHFWLLLLDTRVGGLLLQIVWRERERGRRKNGSPSGATLRKIVNRKGKKNVYGRRGMLFA